MENIMKKIIIGIGLDKEVNKGQLNIFVDEENRGIDFWKKNKAWSYHEIEVEESTYKLLDPKINQLLNYHSGYNVTTIVKAFQSMSEEFNKLKTEVKKNVKQN